MERPTGRSTARGRKGEKTLQAFRRHTGLGTDFWNPRNWAWLGDPGIECLIGILHACERSGKWPQMLLTLLIVLMKKADGGGRPIVLLNSPHRLWESLRGDEVKKWDQAHARDFDWATSGKSSERAVWRLLLEGEAVPESIFVSGLVTIDAEKCYEKIRLDFLWVLGLFFRFRSF